MRCTPGQICIIVGDIEGCEANIGAYVTVTEATGSAWRFKGASRPLLVDADTQEHDFVLADHHLVPVPAGVLAAFAMG